MEKVRKSVIEKGQARISSFFIKQAKPSTLNDKTNTPPDVVIISDGAIEPVSSKRKITSPDVISETPPSNRSDSIMHKHKKLWLKRSNSKYKKLKYDEEENLKTQITRSKGINTVCADQDIIVITEELHQHPVSSKLDILSYTHADKDRLHEHKLLDSKHDNSTSIEECVLKQLFEKGVEGRSSDLDSIVTEISAGFHTVENTSTEHKACRIDREKSGLNNECVANRDDFVVIQEAQCEVDTLEDIVETETTNDICGDKSRMQFKNYSSDSSTYWFEKEKSSCVSEHGISNESCIKNIDINFPMKGKETNKAVNDTARLKTESESCGAPDAKIETGESIIPVSQEDCWLIDWDFTEMSENREHKLNLEKLQRCEILEIVHKSGNQKMLRLQSTVNNAKAFCLIKDIWVASCANLCVGDIVTVTAVPLRDLWCVDNSNGLIVHHPDTLISSTAVINSLFCPRRAVLSQWFKGTDGDSSIMVIGSLVHELLQEVLARKLATELAILNLLQEITVRADVVKMLYSFHMTREDTIKELEQFIPRIIKFVQIYIYGKEEPNVDSFNGTISAICDIEENIWQPKLGIKGKIDVTVEVKIHQHRKVIPLELKTGRPLFSAEHKGQVTLYTMMMSQLGKTVDSGLLLYLRDGIMQEIRSGNNEWRDLIILRNQLAHSVTRTPQLSESGVSFKPLQLPEPINHHSACGKCPYVTLCSSFLRRDGLADLASTNPLVALSASATSHLSEAHLDYLIHWTGLLLLEDLETNGAVQQRDLWCMSAVEREKRGKCLSGMVVSGKVALLEDAYLHKFEKTGRGLDLHTAGLAVGDFVTVSTDIRLAVATGTVQEITQSTVMLLLNKQLASGNTYNIDLYAHQSGKVFNLTNLGIMMDDTNAAAKLRRLIIDREKPAFQEKLHSKIMRPARSILEPLNMGQRRAVVKALTAEDYFLIKGMPGTGKTATIVTLVELLVKLGQSVLVTSHTHSAVDNVLIRLAARNVDFLRLGSSSRIHPQLSAKSEKHLTVACNTPELLHAVYNSKNVVGATCLGAGHPLFAQRIFDYCIVDESTQVLQVSVLRPLLSAKKFILIGDPEQLPPVVKSQRARNMGMSESLFARLQSPDAIVCLDQQYRMNQAITDVANALTYDGLLKCGSKEVSSATLKLQSPKLYDSKCWLHHIMSSELTDSVLLLDTSTLCDTVHQDIAFPGEAGCTNLVEAAIIHNVVNEFLKVQCSKKFQVQQHVAYASHITMMKRRQLANTSSVQSFVSTTPTKRAPNQFFMDLCSALVEANTVKSRYNNFAGTRKKYCCRERYCYIENLQKIVQILVVYRKQLQ